MDSITLNFTNEMMEYHFKNFFFHSLRYYKDKYINLIFNHHQIIPDHVAYLCPLCTKNWVFVTKVSVICSAEFNEDHFPPRNSGGTKTIIACKPCNSSAGYKYDFALEKYIDVLSYNKRIPNSTMVMKHKFDGLSKFMKGKIIIDKDGQLNMHLKSNDTDKIRPLDNWFESNKSSEEWKFEIEPNNPDLKKVHQALLHAAYLYCFESFGYEFIFSKAGELFRKVFNDEAVYPVVLTNVTLDTEEILNSLPIGLCYIKNPKSLQSFVVNLELLNKKTGYKTIQSILIPNPIENGIEKLKIQGEILNSYRGDIEMLLLNNYLKEGIPNAYTKMWEHLQTV